MATMSSSETTWTSEMDKRALHLFWAQALNNKASVCFERGMCKEATTLLHDGLKLLIAINHQHYTETTSDDDCGRGICSSKSTQNISQCCSFCSDGGTLDECITFSEQSSFQMASRVCSEKECCADKTVSNDNMRKNKNPMNNNPRKKRRLSDSNDVANGHLTQNEADASRTKNGYVFQQPIRIPLEGFCQCQRGYTSLLVVIVFNLAIVHHHGIIDHGSPNTSKIENIVFLYNLCLELIRQTEAMVSTLHTRSTTASSTRCEMVIHNNLSQLYRMDGRNTSMQEKSLQDLLSTFMMLIERGTRQQSYDLIDTRRGINTQQNGRVSNLVQGVLENLDTLITKKQCADAA